MVRVVNQALSGPELHRSAETTRAVAVGAFKDAKTTSTAMRASTGLLYTRCNLYTHSLVPEPRRRARTLTYTPAYVLVSH